MCINEEGSLPTALDWRLKTELLKTWDEDIYSILIRFAFGADTFRTSQTGSLFSCYSYLDLDIPGLD